MAELFRTLFQNPFTPQNVTEPEEGIPFQDVRDHMQEIYVLSAEDWENVERVLLWFQNSAGDQTITRAEFFAVYDENGDKCTDPIDSSDFLGKDFPKLSGIFEAEFECDDFQNHEVHRQSFERSVAQYVSDLDELYYDFSLWEAIGTYLQNGFKIPEDKQIRMAQSCNTPDEREERFYLHLRKDLEQALQNWFAPFGQGRSVDRHMVEAMFFYMTEALMGFLRDNPEIGANTLFEVISFFEKNPSLFSDILTVSLYVFPDLYPERQNDSFTVGSYSQAAKEKIVQRFLPNGPGGVAGMQVDFWGIVPGAIFDIAWHWEGGMQDLFLTIDQNVRAFGSYIITTDRGRYTFTPGHVEVEWL